MWIFGRKRRTKTPDRSKKYKSVGTAKSSRKRSRGKRGCKGFILLLLAWIAFGVLLSIGVGSLKTRERKADIAATPNLNVRNSQIESSTAIAGEPNQGREDLENLIAETVGPQNKKTPEPMPTPTLKATAQPTATPTLEPTPMVTPEPTPKPMYLIVTKDDNVRSEADSKSPSLGRAKAGERYLVLDPIYNEKFRQIDYNGQVAYIRIPCTSLE